VELGGVCVNAMVSEHKYDNDGDECDGGELDPEHDACREADVGEGYGQSAGCSDDGEQRPVKVKMQRGEQQLSRVDEAADDGRGSHEIGEEQCQRGHVADGRRKVLLRVDVERAWRRGMAGEIGDRDGDKQHGGHGQYVSQPTGVSCECEDKGNGKRGRGAGRDGGDRLGEDFERGECGGAEAEVLRCWVDGGGLFVEVDGLCVQCMLPKREMSRESLSAPGERGEAVLYAATK